MGIPRWISKTAHCNQAKLVWWSSPGAFIVLQHFIIMKLVFRFFLTVSRVWASDLISSNIIVTFTLAWFHHNESLLFTFNIKTCSKHSTHAHTRVIAPLQHRSLLQFIMSRLDFEQEAGRFETSKFHADDQEPSKLLEAEWGGGKRFNLTIQIICAIKAIS